MLLWLSIAAGGAAGAVSRYFLSRHLNARRDLGLPLGTLLVNLIGSLLVGMLAAYLLQPVDGSGWQGSGGPLWAGLGIGFCGSLTTVSSWSLESLTLFLRRRPGAAVVYGILTMGLCLLMAGLGFWLGGLWAHG